MAVLLVLTQSALPSLNWIIDCGLTQVLPLNVADHTHSTMIRPTYDRRAPAKLGKRGVPHYDKCLIFVYVHCLV